MTFDQKVENKLKQTEKIIHLYIYKIYEIMVSTFEQTFDVTGSKKQKCTRNSFIALNS